MKNVYLEYERLVDSDTRKPLVDVSSFLVGGGPGACTMVDVKFKDGRQEQLYYREPTYMTVDKKGHTHTGLSAHSTLQDAGQWVEIEYDGTMKEGDIAVQLVLTNEPDHVSAAQKVGLRALTHVCNKDGCLERSDLLDVTVQRLISNIAMSSAKNHKDIIEHELEIVAQTFGLELLKLLANQVSAGVVGMPSAPGLSAHGKPWGAPPVLDPYSSQIGSLGGLGSFPGMPDSDAVDPFARKLEAEKARDPSELCPDCKGSGQYVGAFETGDCTSCNGTGIG